MEKADPCIRGWKSPLLMLPREILFEIVRLNLLDTPDPLPPTLTPEFIQNRLPLANAWDAKRPTETNIYVERIRGCDFTRARPLRAVNRQLRDTVDRYFTELAVLPQKPTTGVQKETVSKTGEGDTINKGTEEIRRKHVLHLMVVEDIGLFPTWLTRPPDSDLKHDVFDLVVEIRVVQADVQLFPQQWVAAGQHPRVKSDIYGKKRFLWSMILILFFFSHGRLYWAAPGVVEARAVGRLMEEIKESESKLEKTKKELKEAEEELEITMEGPKAKEKEECLMKRRMYLEWAEEELEDNRAGLLRLQRLKRPQELLERKEELNDRTEGGEMGKKGDEPEEEKEDFVAASPETSPSPLAQCFYGMLSPKKGYMIDKLSFVFLREEHKCTASREHVPTQHADYDAPASGDNDNTDYNAPASGDNGDDDDDDASASGDNEDEDDDAASASGNNDDEDDDDIPTLGDVEDDDVTTFGDDDEDDDVTTSGDDDDRRYVPSSVDDDDDDDDGPSSGDDDDAALVGSTTFGRSILAAPYRTPEQGSHRPRSVPRNQMPSANLYTAIYYAVPAFRYYLSDKTLLNPYMEAIIFDSAWSVSARWGRGEDCTSILKKPYSAFYADRNIKGKEEKDWPIYIGR